MWIELLQFRFKLVFGRCRAREQALCFVTVVDRRNDALIAMAFCERDMLSSALGNSAYRCILLLQVMTNLYSACLDPLLWEEPLDFRPERFLDEHGQVTGQERVVTFGLGKHIALLVVVEQYLIVRYSMEFTLK